MIDEHFSGVDIEIDPWSKENPHAWEITHDKEGKLVATKNSWRNHPMPEGGLEIPLDLRLSTEDFSILVRGHLPGQMEDHWFMFHDEDKFYWVRSWSGMTAFIANVKKEVDEYIVYSATVNPEYSHPMNADEVAKLFESIIERERRSAKNET